MKSPHCPTHRVALVCPSCVQAERGAITSEAKATAARKNGRKGGRPRADGVKRRWDGKRWRYKST